MTIIVECPVCGKTGKAPDEYAGRLAKCAVCKTTIDIPDATGGNEREIELSKEPREVIIKRIDCTGGTVITGVKIGLRDMVNFLVVFWFASVLAIGAIAVIGIIVLILLQPLTQAL